MDERLATFIQCSFDPNQRTKERLDLRFTVLIAKSAIRIPHSQIQPTLATHQISQVRSGLPLLRTSSGEHTVVETPVPIPNTVVKHPGPMIVRALAKVGIARFMAPLGRNSKRGFLHVR